jgi:putative ATP-dependent endonuclease of OLD family
MSFDPKVKLKIKNYKSFADAAQGFERIAPVNVIIGRNNSGKSALIDLVEYIVDPRDLTALGHGGQSPSVLLSVPLADNVIRSVFPENTSGGVIGGTANHFQYGQAWIGKVITVEVGTDKSQTYVSLTPEVHAQFNNELANRVQNPFRPRFVKRILAERNITPELTDQPSLQSDGRGVTNLIRYFLHESQADQSMVEGILLDALNEIFTPDTRFTRIQAKKVNPNEDKWEIYLEEANKGSIALSNSGSGLKTIIQVLAQTILIPKLEQRNINDYIFCFEELENNLHPGLLRRLFGYIRGLAVDHDGTFFITTHNNVVIDLFSGDEQAQLLHVTHDNSSATVSVLTDHSDGSGILDDLDIRASDILQSNGVIWVEGPSDRVYINRYIELMSDGKLREGAHYQCVFYGGRLLARVSADPENDEHVNLLKVNRHACLVMDSDKRTTRARINSTKTRMKGEVEAVDGYVWITDAREIENSIPLDALRAYYSDESMTQVGETESFSDYLNNYRAGEGDVFLANKVLFAEKVVPHITKEMVESDVKLKGHVRKVCNKVAVWNKIYL